MGKYCQEALAGHLQMNNLLFYLDTHKYLIRVLHFMMDDAMLCSHPFLIPSTYISLVPLFSQCFHTPCPPSQFSISSVYPLNHLTFTHSLPLGTVSLIAVSVLLPVEPSCLAKKRLGPLLKELGCFRSWIRRFFVTFCGKQSRWWQQKLASHRSLSPYIIQDLHKWLATLPWCKVLYWQMICASPHSTRNLAY